MYTRWYEAFQFVLYSICQFVLLGVSWSRIGHKTDHRLIDLGLVLVFAIPLLPLIREVWEYKANILQRHVPLYAIRYFTNISLLFGIVSFEYVIGHRFAAAPSLVMFLLYKLVVDDSVLDLCALFLAYTGSGLSTGSSAAEAHLPTFFLLSMGGVLCALVAVWRCLKKR